MIVAALNRDGTLICASAFLRAATVGVIGVVVAIYLSQLGLSPPAIGLVIGAGLGGGAIATLLVGFWADRLGRRRTLVALGLLTAIGYVAFAAVGSLLALTSLAFAGMVNGMGRDRGAASALEQAILPETTEPEQRTWVLALYNLVLDGGHAVGALGGAVPTLMVRWLDVDVTRAHRLTFLLCAAAILVSVVPYAILPDRLEFPANSDAAVATSRLDPHDRRIIIRLALLFGLDSIGGGFLNSALIAYWFFRRFGSSEAWLAVLLFVARCLNAASHLGAAWIARRIGLINTMVLTHLPSSLFLLVAPAAPSAAVAGALFLAREALVEMDVPTRQSYVMAMVRPSERTLASGVTNVMRNTAWAVGPSLAGVVMERVALAGPLVIGAILKIAYDVLLYASFRNIRPPEERRAAS